MADAGQRDSGIRTPDQRLRVFVSSTLEELAGERAAARAAIEQLRMAPVMFESGARPHPAQEVYRAYLEQSDVFVGIYWQRYGWVGPGMAVSGLEDELRLAAGMPRLLYFKVPAPDMEAGLARMLEKVEAEGSSAYKTFAGAEELRGADPQPTWRRCSPSGSAGAAATAGTAPGCWLRRRSPRSSAGTTTSARWPGCWRRGTGGWWC